MQQILYRSRYDGGDFQSGTEHRWEDPADTRRYPSDRCRTGHWTVRTWTGTGYMQMGISLSKSKGLVINARVETVLDKPSFQNGILYHRLLIPAGGFYEWNSLKEKSSFTRPDSSVLYMAGFCDWFENERRFVILTTTANNSMKKIHDRMPLILERGQITDWFDNNKMSVLLRQTPTLLNRQTEYEQQSLFS